jgi:glucose 1-dehydrogenase
MDSSVKGKRVMVTGANSGIGASIAATFAAAGARVCLSVDSGDGGGSADSVVATIRNAGREAMVVRADLSDRGQVGAMFIRLDETWGGLDVLVNNPGAGGIRAVAGDADPLTWERTLRVDLVGAFLCVGEALRRMVRQRGGVILNLTTVHERSAWSVESASAAAEAGLAVLTKSLAKEVAPFGVRVVSLSHGEIRAHLNLVNWSKPAGLDGMSTKSPLARMGEIEEIARLATFLASDDAAYLSGGTVYADGRMTRYPEASIGTREVGTGSPTPEPPWERSGRP